MEWYIYPAIVAVGLVTGFINTLAGSGSLLTLPFLMFLGLPANVANGTNRVGVLMQSIVGAFSFRKQKVFNFSEGTVLLLPATAGALLGAIIAVDLNEELMETIIGGLLIFMFFVILVKPEKWIREHADKINSKPTFWNIVISFLIGIYGGFIQAGVGFFLLAWLVLGVGADLVKANALKVFIVMGFTLVALVVFFVNRQVDLKIGLILAAGNMGGAWIAAKSAVKRGAVFVRWILLITVFLAGLKLFGLFDFLFG
ncbi:MAG: sulfite exporter TauE/SafE family protein [Bacteroidales bacterium]|nr:sulfite exporter TauE/SafE family protein [Bacteroidales bacterium]